MISDGELEQAHLHILTNDCEIDPYVKEHNRSFVVWLREHISSTSTHSTCQISSRLKWMVHGPHKRVLKYQSYMIDGVTYHIMERDDLRAVQNCGVSLVAKTMQLASAKDKNQLWRTWCFMEELRKYGSSISMCKFVLFKCSWVENKSGVKVDDLGFTLVDLKKIGYKNDSFILGSLVKQVFYIEDPQDPTWSVVLACPSKEYLEFINGDELGDTGIHHQCFTTGVPTMDLNDEHDENEPPWVRGDCDGTWVDNVNS